MEMVKANFCAITISGLTKARTNWVVVSLLLLSFTCLPLKAREQKLFPIVMQLDWIHNVQFAGIYQAIEQGYYKSAGLVVEIRPVTFGQDTVERVLETKHCIGSAESNVLLAAHSNGADIKALATMFQGSPMGWMYLKESGVVDIKDFRGKRIGIHPDGEKVIQLALAHEGIEIPNLETMKVGYNVEILLNGEVDVMQGYLIDEFIKLQLESDESAGILMAKDHGYLAYSQVFFTDSEFLKGHPEQIEAFLEASEKGWEYALSHIEASARLIIEKYNPELQHAHQEKSLESIRELVMPDGMNIMAPMDYAVWSKSQEQFLAQGILERGANLKELLEHADIE